MIVEVLIICLAVLCGQAMFLFGPRLLDDKKKLAYLEEGQNILNTKLGIVESDLKELKDRVSKQQLKGISR